MKIEATKYELLRTNLPLRLFCDGDKRVLSCPNKFAPPDDVQLGIGFKKFGEIPQIAHFRLESRKGEGESSFLRHILYSSVGGGSRNFVTMSGYMYTGPIEIPSPLRRLSFVEGRRLGTQIIEEAKVLKKTRGYHITGDSENETGGLGGALDYHAKNISEFEVDEVSYEGASDFYLLLSGNAPRYW